MQAKGFYADFVQGMRDKYAEDKVKDGEFGAMMDVALVNDVSPGLQYSIAVVRPVTEIGCLACRGQ